MRLIYCFAARLQDGFKHLALSRHPVFTDAVSIKLKSGFHIRMPAATLGCNRDGEGKKRKSKNREAAVPFLPGGMVTERSSPSRVSLRRKERALDRSGPLCKPSRHEGKGDFRKDKSKST